MGLITTRLFPHLFVSWSISSRSRNLKASTGAIRPSVLATCSLISQRACSGHPGTQGGCTVARHSVSSMDDSDAAQPSLFDVAVVGGGIAGLAAISRLSRRGLRLLLVEQGRGVGGRMCTRHASCPKTGHSLVFDHGCQYFSVKEACQPQFAQEVERWLEAGVVQHWQGRIGTLDFDEDEGSLDMSSFTAFPKEKLASIMVGAPSMSALGRHILGRAGVGRKEDQRGRSIDIVVKKRTRAENVQWHSPSRRWRLQLASRTIESTATEVEARVLVVATSANSINRLLPTSVPDEVKGINSPVCWALLVAVASPLAHIPFDGAFVANSADAGVLAWVARDSSKPGRPGTGNAPECWVLHASAGWSYSMREASTDIVREAMLAEFTKDFGTQDVVYSEAFRWNNAFPLNPMRGTAKCLVDSERHLALGGDWAAGDRVGDAFESGVALAASALALL